ncbi:hypothetical protein ACIQYG_24100 [Peribacillus sp. NPDC096622]|jgi:hypothetical protein|uniref:hypothetical protein n=1 Tax=Bacillaceae TaxID=186817 RepID=UPI00105A3741|nr:MULTISPECIES: hypothetical protein [unclassified Bacillus (in: firmicutes)]MDO7485765.1 hypothetical protein [Peribacillus frigoritolerans]TDL85390.1 hypothetical protein E2R55_25195 [Vibrio vulnificus]MBT2617750.1 hypothetical protein [Bacillus sp. ISL-78]MBT2629599.1 hypothetical protein [Bacillus sp. ISL-101]MBT2719266.1 hypothetical protein [Bacillus sp. ISL-57]
MFNEVLNNLITHNIQVATDTTLVEGLLVKSQSGLIEIVESITGYENQTRLVIIPIVSINFVRVAA